MKLHAFVVALVFAINPPSGGTAHADPIEQDDEETDFWEVIDNFFDAGWTCVDVVGDTWIISQDLGPVVQYLGVTPGNPSEIVGLGTFVKNP